jgi:hypothetical protein
VNEAADEAGGQGFVTEFAGPSGELAAVVWGPSDEAQWTSVRNATYADFDELFAAVYFPYQSFSGFWDAVRRTVTLPQGVAFEDFVICPRCYANDVQFSPSALLDAIESDVIEPQRSVQTLIDQAPYVTRLYSTLSAAEMTVDPVFLFNPDLPPLNNVHRASRIIECNEGVYVSEASWRIELPQGTVIRGTANGVGQWPSAVDDQPPNFRVLMLSASGEGEVVADNSALIDDMLADYNAGVPRPKGDSDGFCNLATGPLASRASGGLAAPAAWALALLLGASRLRRAHRRR